MLRVVVRSDVLDGVLQAARNYYPDEFFCFLAGRKEGDTVYVEEIVFLPFESSEGGAHVDLLKKPILESIVGSVHSHPFPSAYSSQDLQSFPYFGDVHLIVFPPFDRASFVCYDAKGRELAVEIV